MIVFDEKEYALKMLKKGFKTKNKKVFELNILAKHYIDEGKDTDEIKKLLTIFLDKFEENFNSNDWYKIINNTISSAKRKKIVKDKAVEITKAELETIKALNNDREERVAFVILVLYKFYEHRKFEISIKDLFSLAKFTTINSSTKLDILQSLTSNNIIDIDVRGYRSSKIVEQESDVVITITNFDDFIYEYDFYLGNHGFKKCEACGKVIKIIKGNNKYCNKCRLVIREIQSREKSLRYYHKNKR